jgi:RecG-like helicase
VAVLQARQAAKGDKAADKAKVAKIAMVAEPTEETAAEQAATAKELALEADVALRRAVPDGRRPRGPVATPGVTAIGALTTPGKATVEGKVRVVEIRPVERNSVLAVEINDTTGNLTAMFYGRSHIPGLICGARVRLSGSVGVRSGQPVMINPAYELVAPGA